MENIEYATKNLPENIRQFFQQMQNYLGTSIYFYGSLMRNDYFHGKSDIDIDIFTENETSMIFRLSHFLSVKKDKFKRVVWRLNHNNQVVYGNKIMYRNDELGLACEISVYNDKFQKGVLFEHRNKLHLPFYASWLLICLKFIYYQLQLVNKETFIYLKRKIMSIVIGLPNDDFLTL